MLVLPPSVYLVLRRLGARQVGSLIGGSLYAMGSVPAAAWLRLTGEPIGTLFLLGAAALAHGWSDAQPSKRRMVALALCLTGMLFSKETLVACLPFLCGIAMCWSAKTDLTRPRLTPWTMQFVGICLATCVVLGVALLWAASLQRPDAYSTLYGASVISSRGILTRGTQLALPVSYYTDLWRLLVFPPNFVFVSCIVLGLVGLMRGRQHNQTTAGKLLISGSLPAAGIAVYLPWPRFEHFFWLPFLFGIALGIAVLVDSSTSGARSRLFVILCWLFVLTGSGLHAFGLAQQTKAQRRLNYAVAREIAIFEPTDSVLIASGNLTSQPWQNPAATLSRYVRAVGLTPVPPILVDTECRDGQRFIPGSEASYRVAMVYESGCGHAPHATRTIEHAFRYFEWSGLTFARGVQRVAVIERPEQ
jgi:hypothetical protein